VDVNRTGSPWNIRLYQVGQVFQPVRISIALSPCRESPPGRSLAKSVHLSRSTAPVFFAFPSSRKLSSPHANTTITHRTFTWIELAHRRSKRRRRNSIPPSSLDLDDIRSCPRSLPRFQNRLPRRSAGYTMRADERRWPFAALESLHRRLQRPMKSLKRVPDLGRQSNAPRFDVMDSAAWP